ncbi:alginate lyase family protein [Halobacteriaceae bacterium SHR40]|uniref:heparinase II/III domain-containing protein n=1 Tax=Halovenus amylolytica TaxID=2500550 RepID=UPI000FE3F656
MTGKQETADLLESEPEESDADTPLPVELPDDWSLIYHTLRNMKARQLGGILERKARHAVVPRLPVDFDDRYARQVPESLSVTTAPISQNLRTLGSALTTAERKRYRRRFEDTLDGRFTFLNRTIEFDDGIDWDHGALDEYPLLWRLKLQSFQHLEWLTLGYESPTAAPAVGETVARQLRSWAAANSIGEQNYLRRSWIPHAVSMRILNWSRYAAWAEQAPQTAVPEQLYGEIFRNALFLSNHVEYEVDGNHLIENAIALLMAGVLFGDHDTGWTEQGLALLKQVGTQQFLADGGHFERSPMYHVMALRRYVTAYDLLSGRASGLGEIERIASEAMGFLTALTSPDGAIPLLNDSVYREQLSARACLAYAEACSLEPRRVNLDHPDGSGYRMLTSGGSTLLVDVGEPGPPHLPGHSHNDQLSVLLWIDGDPLLTDTGVYDYGSNARRRYARSVRAHNTAQYGTVEPIPIGGSYLMGKRSTVAVGRCDDRSVRATCERRARGPNYSHHRTVTATAEGWEITDHIDADQTAEYTVRYHFHPDIDVFPNQDGFTAQTDGRAVAKFQFSGVSDRALTTSPYFEAYGHERDRPAIELSTSTTNKTITKIIIL